MPGIGVQPAVQDVVLFAGYDYEALGPIFLTKF
jgi:hypothetical protein